MNKDYLQPDFYRFNEDSIKLVHWILNTGPKVQSLVDLGAGSGVIGIELARVLKPKDFILVELQNEFKSYLEHNCQEFLPSEVIYNIVIKSFKEFTPQKKYDLVVCNPPYYLPGQGEKAKDPNRAIARSFLTDSWRTLIEKISQLLTIEGKGYLVLKPDEKLFQLVQLEVKLTGLKMIKHQLDSVIILELFRLDKN